MQNQFIYRLFYPMSIVRPVSGLLAFLLGLGSVGCARLSLPPTRIQAGANDPYAPRAFAAALLEETNRVRAVHGVPPLRGMTQLDAAADDQASIMALRLRVEHESALPGQGTPLDRLLRHGVAPVSCAENVGAVPVGTGDSMATVGVIAAALVDAWMNSPGHRANLLNPRMTHLGASARLAHGVQQQWYAFGVQDFARLSPSGAKITGPGF